MKKNSKPHPKTTATEWARFFIILSEVVLFPMILGAGAYLVASKIGSANAPQWVELMSGLGGMMLGFGIAIFRIMKTETDKKP